MLEMLGRNFMNLGRRREAEEKDKAAGKTSLRKEGR